MKRSGGFLSHILKKRHIEEVNPLNEIQSSSEKFFAEYQECRSHILSIVSVEKSSLDGSTTNVFEKILGFLTIPYSFLYYNMNPNEVEKNVLALQTTKSLRVLKLAGLGSDEFCLSNVDDIARYVDWKQKNLTSEKLRDSYNFYCVLFNHQSSVSIAEDTILQLYNTWRKLGSRNTNINIAGIDLDLTSASDVQAITSKVTLDDILIVLLQSGLLISDVRIGKSAVNSSKVLQEKSALHFEQNNAVIEEVAGYTRTHTMFWFGVAESSSFVRRLSEARVEIRKKLLKKTYKECSRKEMERLKFKGIPISNELIIRDAVGRGIVEEYESPSGKMLRLVQ